MRGNALPALGLLAAGLLAGCAGSSTASPSSASPPVAAAAVTPTASTDAEGDSATLMAGHDGGVYGFSADIDYVSATPEHLLSASMTADGMVLKAEMYQDGVDDDGPPQQPRLKAGEHLGVSVFAVPRCEVSTLGAAPVLTVTLVDSTGAQVTRKVPVADLRLQLATGARAWCEHGVQAALQSAEGTEACRFDRAEFLVRNPTLQAATVTLDGTDYTTPVAQLAAGGSVTLHLTRTGSCTTSSKAIATLVFADGTTSKLDLPFAP